MESAPVNTDKPCDVLVAGSNIILDVNNKEKSNTPVTLGSIQQAYYLENHQPGDLISSTPVYEEPVVESSNQQEDGIYFRNTDKPVQSHPCISENDSFMEQHKNLRPRRSIKKRFVDIEEDEWEKLLNDDVALHQYGPGQHVDIEEASSNKWIAVEQILGSRKLKRSKITKAVSEAIDSFSPNNKEIVENEYFVKFIDQSYWHCAWMNGAVLFTLNPSKTRAYLRAKQNCSNRNSSSNSYKPILNSDSSQVTNLDFSIEQHSEDSNYGDATSKCVKAGCKLTILVSHSSEEESDDEDDLSKWSKDAELDVNEWIANYPKRAGSRRRYLLRWGVESHTLIPERVLAIGEAFTPEKFKRIEKSDNKNKSNRPFTKMKWPEYREVLVKWLHLPYIQATWETVESDLLGLDSLETYCKNHRNTYTVLDPCGRNLLPRLVRRHIIWLTDTYCSRVATILCDTYGNQLIPGRKNINTENWKSKWIGEQPDYLSPIHRGLLHPYQIEGARWLWHAYHNNINAILADEMGLGKTVQVIALLYSLWKEENDYGPFIIMAPLSTLQNWEREFLIWAPDFYIVVYSGDKQVRAMLREYEFRLRNAGGIPAFHVLITSHELACIDRSFLKSFDWSVLVVDEAHRLKNKQSRFFKDTSQYHTKFKILLTGTPLQNNLEELFHLLNFVEPKKFTDFRALSEQWAEMPKADRIEHLHDLLKHHLLRRLKCDVIQDLPKKTEIVVPVDMTLLQRRLYKYILTNNYEELRCGNLMNSIIHLQKVCNHPYLMQIGDAIAPRLNPDDKTNGPYEPKALVQVSSKLVVLMELLRGLFVDDHRVLIFSRFTMMLDLLEEVMINAKYKYVRIDGRVRGPLRQVTIDRFNAPNSEFFIFLLSTRAGGEGINLASADTVVLYDSDWNPQWDLQALSRAHRIGQSKHVVIYRFITRHSIEEKISQVARRKLALTQLIVDQHKKRAETLETLPIFASEQHGTVQGDNSSKTDSNIGNSKVGQDTNPVESTQRQSNTKSANRLTRSEMDELLRSGVEALFASDDPYSTEDLYDAARVDEIESKDSYQRIVYDSQAIAKLLDRSKMITDSEQTVSAADEYLSGFRVAHFDETNAESVNNSNVKDNEERTQRIETSEETTESINSTIVIGETCTESIGYADFWDKLLRERHERLVNAELEATNKSKRNHRDIYKQIAGDTIADKSTDLNDVIINKALKLEKDDGNSTDSHVSEKEKLFNRTEAVREVTKLRLSRQDLRKVFSLYHGFEDEKLESLVAELKNKYANVSHKNRRTRACPSKPMPASVKRARSSKASTKTSYRHYSFAKCNVYHITDSEDSLDEYSIPEISDDDPSYLPSDESDSVEAVQVKESLPSNRTRRSSTLGFLSSEIPVDSSDSEEFLAWESSFREVNPICWYPTVDTYAKWRARVFDLGHHITWHRDELFIYNFGPNDRQLFNNAVMRFGLPPPGIVPPQDWLPPVLYHKSQFQLFGYVCLYMKHLYDDPSAFDESQESWSDGLPKEHLCVPAVLSRIAMMALIRNKVLQYEDINGPTSISADFQNTAFEFAIHEGGLTLLRSAWDEECMEISNIWRTIQSHPDTARNSELIMKIQGVWHSRHDYWLLAGILIHGYSRWTDILADPRFRILSFGLSGVLNGMGRLMNTDLSSHDTFSGSRRTPSESTEAQAFLLDRLKLLEQALIVEQALHEVAEAALTSSAHQHQSDPVRTRNLAICLSNKLIQTGARKRIALPKDPKAKEATRSVVQNLQELLEDMYADLPGMPASVTYTGGDDSNSKEKTLKTIICGSTSDGVGEGGSLTKIISEITEVDLCRDVEQDNIANCDDGQHDNNVSQSPVDGVICTAKEKVQSDHSTLLPGTLKLNNSPPCDKGILIELSDDEGFSFRPGSGGPTDCIQDDNNVHPTVSSAAENETSELCIT
ncbi:Chromodomain-helicase-DNA-binding protein 5 [Schistosoma japonicum]|nr:Chromodomain-helicase-DNA-binding protein 5 [Schistosoma japonicum]KAH8865871.1 Chromodomain-helicase-DNA-binding protein 5 [Schistosoma japonicum]